MHAIRETRRGCNQCVNAIELFSTRACHDRLSNQACLGAHESASVRLGGSEWALPDVTHRLCGRVQRREDGVSTTSTKNPAQITPGREGQKDQRYENTGMATLRRTEHSTYREQWTFAGQKLPKSCVALPCTLAAVRAPRPHCACCRGWPLLLSDCSPTGLQLLHLGFRTRSLFPRCTCCPQHFGFHSPDGSRPCWVYPQDLCDLLALSFW